MKIFMRLHSHKLDGSINKRFHKFRYTAALRLGVVPKIFNDVIDFEFDGNVTNEVQAHKNNIAFEGALTIDKVNHKNLILIANPLDNGRYGFVTFWPISQHPDAHESYTDPLVDTAVDGTPFDIEIVATKMHEHFKNDAGVSPATLMKKIYEDEGEELKNSASKLGALIEEALLISKLESDRADKEKIRADVEAKRADDFELESKIQRQQIEEEKIRNERLKMENEELRKAAYIEPPKDEELVISSKVKLIKAREGVAGKFNQRAVVLELSDNTTRTNNWKNGFMQRLAYAKSLEGSYITTDVWGGYDGNKWFKNIYKSE
jgi:hypothetical protein